MQLELSAWEHEGGGGEGKYSTCLDGISLYPSHTHTQPGDI